MGSLAKRGIKYLLDLSKAEKKAFLESFDLILTDCDGVIWHLTSPIEGASESIELLQKARKKFGFVSNNSVRSQEYYTSKVNESKIDATIDEFIHPVISTVDYFKQTNFKGLVYLIASENFKKILEENGYECITGPNNEVPEDFHHLLKTVTDKQPVKAVVIDFDYNVNQTKLMRAQMYLRQPDCILISGATDSSLPVAKNVNLLGPGLFTEILAKSSGKHPIVVGKPGNELKDILYKKYNITDGKRILFMGDTLEQDIGFGRHCNFQTLLVLTGSSKVQTVLDYPNEHHMPDYYLNSISEFKQFFDDINN